MAQLELLPVAPRTHICWDPVPAACLALLSWSSASPTLLLAKSFPTFQQPPPAVLPAAGILDSLAPLQEEAPELVLKGFSVTQLRGAASNTLKNGAHLMLYNRVHFCKRLQARQISSRVRKMLLGLLRLRNLGLLEYTEFCARILCARPIWLASNLLTTHPQHPNYCNFSFA